MGAVHNMTYAQEEKWDISQNTKNLIKNGKKSIDNTFVSAFSPKAVATAPVVAET